jgi:hypothetical protein
MARGEDENRMAEGDAAKRRLAAGISRTRSLVAQYRARLLLLRRADPERRGRLRLVATRG